MNISDICVYIKLFYLKSKMIQASKMYLTHILLLFMKENSILLLSTVLESHTRGITWKNKNSLIMCLEKPTA